MKKYLLLLIIGLAFGSNLVAQELTIEYNFGYGLYKMENLKDAISSSQIELNNIKVTDKFPGNYTHQMKLGIMVGKLHQTGLSLDFMNTLGNTGVSDYSGSYNFTIRTHGVRLGGFYRIFIPDLIEKRVNPYFQFTTGVVFNDASLDEELILHNIGDSRDKLDLNGINFFVEPTVGCKIKLIQNLALNLSVGYEFDLTKNLKDVLIYPDWSGFRFQGGLIYSIPFAAKK